MAPPLGGAKRELVQYARAFYTTADREEPPKALVVLAQVKSSLWFSSQFTVLDTVPYAHTRMVATVLWRTVPQGDRL